MDRPPHVGPADRRGRPRHGLGHAAAREDARLRAVHRPPDQPDPGEDQDDRRPDRHPGPGDRRPGRAVPGGDPRSRRRPPGLGPEDRPLRWLGRRRGFRLLPDRPAVARQGQRILRGPDDRGVRPRVPEQPHQLPRPPAASRPAPEAGTPGDRSPGGGRPHPGRDRDGGQPEAGPPRLVCPDGRDHGDLPVLRARPQEPPRLGQAGIPGRRGPADQHPARTDQARRRLGPVGGGGRLQPAVLGPDPGRPARLGRAPLQRRRRQLLPPPGVRPGPESLRSLADHAPERPAGYRLLPDRRRRRVASLSRQGPPRPDGHAGQPRLQVPGLYRDPTSDRGRRGRGRRDRGDRGSRSTPGPTSPRGRGTSTSASSIRRGWTSTPTTPRS